MSQLRVHCLSMSLDGYVAGPDQSLEEPLGVGGERLHEWMFETRTCRRDRRRARRRRGHRQRASSARGSRASAPPSWGATCSGPSAGGWSDEEWRGWWGPDPPYHHPVFVLTHHPHAADRDGGRHHVPLRDRRHRVGARAGASRRRARRTSGSAAAPRPSSEYLRAGLVDDLHYAIAPVLLGAGERLFDDDLGDAADRYECAEMTAGEGATHVRLTRRT